MADERGEITALLDALRGGSPDAESRLFLLVYGRLKQLARGYLRRERLDHSLHATDLVHEAYLKMAGAEANCGNRAHFFCVAAQAMRRILVDHARARRAGKRGGSFRHVPVEEAVLQAAGESEHLIEIDEALRKLAALDPRQARVVELRYFAGLWVEETAEALECSDQTIKREWRMAQAWLRGELSARLP